MKKISERRHTVLVILIIIAAVGIPIVLKETVLAYFSILKHSQYYTSCFFTYIHVDILYISKL